MENGPNAGTLIQPVIASHTDMTFPLTITVEIVPIEVKAIMS